MKYLGIVALFSLTAFLGACSTEITSEGVDSQVNYGWVTLQRNYSEQCLTVTSTGNGLYMDTCTNRSEQNFQMFGSQLISRHTGAAVIGSNYGDLFQSGPAGAAGYIPSDYRDSDYVKREQTGAFARFKFSALGDFCMINNSVQKCTGSYGEYWQVRYSHW